MQKIVDETKLVIDNAKAKAFETQLHKSIYDAIEPNMKRALKECDIKQPVPPIPTPMESYNSLLVFESN